MDNVIAGDMATGADDTHQFTLERFGELIDQGMQRRPLHETDQHPSLDQLLYGYEIKNFQDAHLDIGEVIKACAAHGVHISIYNDGRTFTAEVRKSTGATEDKPLFGATYHWNAPESQELLEAFYKDIFDLFSKKAAKNTLQVVLDTLNHGLNSQLTAVYGGVEQISGNDQNSYANLKLQVNLLKQGHDEAITAFEKGLASDIEFRRKYIDNKAGETFEEWRTAVKDYAVQRYREVVGNLLHQISESCNAPGDKTDTEVKYLNNIKSAVESMNLYLDALEKAKGLKVYSPGEVPSYIFDVRINTDDATIGGKTNESVSYGKQRILVVDDEELMRGMMKAMLETHFQDYSVDTAASGDEALELARKSLYALVITDYLMTGMNGNEFIEELRKMPAYERIPIIGMTGHCTGSGMFGENVSILGKPFGMNDAKKMVQDALNAPSNNP